MFDHLMRKPFDLPLKNGGNVRVKPLSLRDMGAVMAEMDPMRRMAVAVQRSLLDENDNLAFSIAPAHYILGENGDLVLSADPVDYIFDEMDQRVLTEIGHVGYQRTGGTAMLTLYPTRLRLRRPVRNNAPRGP